MSQKIISNLHKISLAISKVFSSSKFLYFVIGLFILQALYVLFSVKIGIPPDELTHIRFIEFYTRQDSLSPIIASQTDTFALGDVTREISYLYHYLMSLVIRLIGIGGLPAYVILRLVGLAMSVATIVFSVKAARLLKAPNSVIAVSVLVVTNMAQFLLMSIAINNDNLVWLLSSVCLFVSVKLWQSNSSQAKYLLMLLTLLAFGVITKKTFMPLAAIFGASAVYYLWVNRLNLKKYLSKLGSIELVLFVCLALGTGLVAERIGMNLFRYGQFDVDCGKIHSVEQCSNYGVYRRNAFLYRNESSLVRDKDLTEFSIGWWDLTIGRSFGVQAWPGFIMTSSTFNLAVFLLLWLSVLLAVKNYKKHLAVSAVVLVSLYYIFFNLFVNYSLYQRWGVFDLALQGRYIFPILVPLVTFGSYVLWQGLSTQTLAKLRAPLAAAAILSVVFVSGLQLFISDTRFIENPIKPVIIFKSSDAISKYEPGI